MYLKRKADEFLDEWKKNSRHLPLIVKGARQVGKTETIRHFAARNYENIVEINFAVEKAYRSIAANSHSPQAIIQQISLIDPSKRFTPGKTLIFFDEFQECPDIVTSLKFFSQDGRFDVICSGSLPGTHYKRIHSISVGYKTDYEMYSLDFEEFLWANGYDDRLPALILEHMMALKPFDDLTRNRLSDLFSIIVFWVECRQ